MSNLTVSVTVEQVASLLSHARKIGTVDNWCELALDWMRASNANVQSVRDEATKPLHVKIERLRGLLLEAEALLCDERAGPAAHELAVRIRDVFSTTVQPEAALVGQLIVTPGVCDCEPAPLGCNFPFCKADKSPADPA